MRSNVVMEVALEYSRVFSENETVQGLLSGFSKSRLMKLAAFLLGFNGRNSKYFDNKEFLSAFFSQENAAFAESVYARIKKLEEDEKRPLMIYNHLSSLKLFEFAYNNLNDEDNLTNEISEIKLFKAYLLLNEENNRVANGHKYQIEHLPVEQRPNAISFVLSIANFDVLNYYRRDVIVSQLIRSVYLFEFLELNKQTAPLLKSFYEYYGCNHWSDFLKKLLPLIFICYQRKEEAHTDITVDQDSNYEATCQFIDKLIIDNTDSFQDYDFITLRSKPLYKVANGHYRTIFELFLFDLLHTGVYFKLSNLNGQLNRSEKIPEFRSFYCDEFSEKHLLYSILNRIYEKKHVCFPGESIKATGMDAEPDFYIRNGNKIFLFESKDVLMPAEIKTSFNYIILEAELKKKFYFDATNQQRVKPKAVMQLINNIKRILDKAFAFDAVYKASNVIIYPIVVLHHRHWEIAGLNKIVQTWFQDELNKLQQQRYNTANVRPLTFIGVDTLILYQDLLISNRFRLEKLIDEYHLKTRYNPKIRFKSESQMYDYANRTLIPFSHYMVLELSKMNHVPVGPKLLMEKGLSVFG